MAGYHITRVRLAGLTVALFLMGLYVWSMLQRRSETQAGPPELRNTDMLPPRQKILAETSSESIEQSVEALPTFTDMALATSIGCDVCVESYDRSRVMFPRLTRVRKLLAQINPPLRAHYAPMFIRRIEESMAGYPSNRADTLAKIAGPQGYTSSEPDPYDKQRMIAGALVYLLTEWDYRQALPVFQKMLEQRDPIPVNRVFLLYSAHLLILQLPTDGFSEERLRKLKAYEALAGRLLPSVERVQVTAWNASFDEMDFRAVILRERVPIDKEPKLSVRFYPEMEQAERFGRTENGKIDLMLTPEFDALQRTMLSFLRSE